MPTQIIGDEWQLDRLDQRDLPLDGEFTYEADGTGVRAYFIDYGVRDTHDELTGKVVGGHSVVGGDPFDDQQGHGTPVASLIAGETTGVAKGASLFPVQVAVTGSISNSALSDAADWIIANHPGGPAVVNISLGQQGGSNTLDDVVRRLIGAGFPTVVSAGNWSRDVGRDSPGRVHEAIVVGATTSGDEKRSTSNYGPGVTLFAPGEDVWVATNDSDDSYGTFNGASGSAALVTGVVACILQNYPDLSHQQLKNYLVWASTKERLTDLPKFTPNRLLYSPLMVEQWLAVERAKRYRPVRRPVRSFEQQGGVWGLGNPWPTLGEPFDPPDPTPTVLEGWGVPI